MDDLISATSDPGAALQRAGDERGHAARAGSRAASRDPGRGRDRDDAEGRPELPGLAAAATRGAADGAGRLTVADRRALRDAAMRFGARTLFEHLDLDVDAGRVPRGARSERCGEDDAAARPARADAAVERRRSRSTAAPPRRGSHDVGYVPQQRAFDRDLPIRGPRSRAVRPRRPSARAAVRHRDEPRARRRRDPIGRRASATPTRRSGCCRAVSSSGCASRRR